MTVVNDGTIDGNVTTTITASATGFQNTSDSAVVVDDNVPALTLTLAVSTVSEAAGAGATTGTVSIQSPTSQPLTIACEGLMDGREVTAEFYRWIRISLPGGASDPRILALWGY